MSERCLKHVMQIAGILVLAGMNVQAAHDSRPADVTVYVKGGGEPPTRVDFGARDTVTRMYARIGVRLAWSHDPFRSGTVSGSPVSIEIRFARESPINISPDTLAFARPFADGANAITVMYYRIVAFGGTGRQHNILAHVLAHEIGHVLQGSDGHSQTGVMKAHWNRQDLDAMQMKPLEFTPEDVALIVRGLTGWKSQTAASTHGHDIVLPSRRGSK